MSASFVDTIASKTMNLDLTKTIGAATTNRIETLCNDILMIVIRMRDAEELGEPAALRKLINHYINLFESNCKAMKISSTAIAYTKYALIALLDETVLSLPGPCRDYWISSPMQLEHFGDNIAGEEFYRKLDKLMMEPEKMREILGIFYLCLSLGFEGKYKMFKGEERLAIMDNLGRVLIKTRKSTNTGLSPHGHRVSLNTNKDKSISGLFPLWAFGSIAVVIMVITYVVLTMMSNSHLNNVLQLIGNH